MRHKGLKDTYHPGMSAIPKEWDKKRQRFKNDQTQNEKLQTITTTIEQIIKRIDRIPTEEEIQKQIYHPPTAPIIQNPTPGPITIQTACLQKGKEIKEQLQSENTHRHYSRLAGGLARFIRDKQKTETHLHQINSEFISQYIQYMNEQNLAAASVTKMVQTLIEVLDRFGHPDQYKHIKVPTPLYADKIYLTETEVHRIAQLQLPQGSALEHCRNLFLAAYSTALRFCDWTQLRPEQIQTIKNNQVIKITQQKTKAPITVPLMPKVAEIISSHPHIGDVTNQYFNREIKKVCELAGITQNVVITEYRQGKAIQTIKRKCDCTSSHTARRSFATNAYLAGIPIIDIMKFTGHKSVASLIVYIRITIDETAITYAQHPFFLQSAAGTYQESAHPTPTTPTPYAMPDCDNTENGHNNYENEDETESPVPF